MEEALQYLRELRDHGEIPLIAFVGHVCRTWYADESTTGAVMEILREACMYRPVHTKPVGFDFMLRNIAGFLGLVSLEMPALGPMRRDPAMLDGVAMVVAFPVEKAAPVDEDGRLIKDANRKREDWSTCDPELAETIKAMGLPVLVVYRDGVTYWIAPRGET